MTNTGGTPAGWYHAPGDPEGTQRYWDGAQWIGDPQAVQQQAPQQPTAPQAPEAPQPPPASDATVAYSPPPSGDPGAGQPPSGGQPPQYGAPPGGQASGGQQPPAFGAPPAGGQQPPTYGSPPPGGGAPPGYTEFGGPGAVPQAGNLAEGWQRLVARLIDGIIVGVAGAIIGILVSIAFDGFLDFFVSGLVGLAIGVAYEIVVTSQLGATLGKKIFNMRIVNEADGSKVDDSVMLKRYMPSIVIGVIGLVPLIGWLISGLLGLVFVILSIVWIFTDEKRRSVYDKVGDTIVIVDG